MPKKPPQIKKQDKSLEGRIGLVYARVSSKRQEKEGNGLESQEGRCKTMLMSLNVPYLMTFHDSYTGGGDFLNRPAMRNLLRYIDDNPHKRFVVVFDDLKRFAREVEFHFKLKTAFRIRNVILECLNYKFDDSPEGQFAELIMAGQSELERHQNKRQVIQKQSARLENGYWPFGNKKGYLIEQTEHGKLAVPHPIEGQLLRRALTGFATGEFVRKVDACAFLVESGFWKRKKPGLYISKFDQFLKDPFYCGDIQYSKWEITRRPGKHKGLISLEIFNLIQRRLNEENRAGRKIRSDIANDFPLRGLIICADCNKHLTSAWSKSGTGKVYPYYFCQNRNCKSYRKSWSKTTVENEFELLLKSISVKENVAETVIHVFAEAWNNEIDGKIKTEEDSRIAVSLLEEKIERFSNLIADAKSPVLQATYERQLEKLLKEVEEIDINTKDDNLLAESYRTALLTVMELLKNPYKTWKNLNLIEKHRLFYFIFENKLPYSKKSGYRTDKSLYNATLFEEFAPVHSPYVDIEDKIYKKVKEFLKRFWEYYNTSPDLKTLLND